MDKEILRKYIGESIYYHVSVWNKDQSSIDELDALQELKEQGATFIDLDITHDYEVIIKAYNEYEETDEEYIQRKEKEKKELERLLAAQLKAEKRQYEILKQKFEGNNG